MAYVTGLYQRYKNQLLSTNISAQDQSVDETNLALIANLRFVQEYISDILGMDLLPDNNPNFTGVLSSTTGGNISVSSLSVPTIVSNTVFTGSPTLQSQPIDAIIPGEIIISTTSKVPPNFLFCDGTLYSTTTYSRLFSLIGYNYGGSNGMFATPNFVSRFPIGANGFQSVPVSNFASGNNVVNSNSTYSITGGLTTPVWKDVPQHTHNIIDGYNNAGHPHVISAYSPQSTTFIPSSDLAEPYCYALGSLGSGDLTTLNTTGVQISQQGTNLQAGTFDPVSNLAGVNVSPPYLAVNYWIAY